MLCFVHTVGLDECRISHSRGSGGPRRQLGGELMTPRNLSLGKQAVEQRILGGLQHTAEAPEQSHQV